MKIFFLIPLTSLLFAACSNAPGPGDTVIEMYKKMCAAKSIKPMIDYAAPESLPLLEMAAKLYDDKDKGPKLTADLVGRCEKGIKVKEEKVSGDTAVVVMLADDKPTDLRKIDGKWKVTISKNDKKEKSDSQPAIQSDKKDESNADACIDKKLGQVRKEIGPDAVISRAIITEIEESCGGKI